MLVVLYQKESRITDKYSHIYDIQGGLIYANKLRNDALKSFKCKLFIIICSCLNNNGLTLMDSLFSWLTLPSISSEKQSTVNAHIFGEKVIHAIRFLQSGNAPRPDGFSKKNKKCSHSLIDPCASHVKPFILKQRAAPDVEGKILLF